METINNQINLSHVAKIAAQQRESLYKSVFDSVSDAILVLNREGEIIDKNRSAKELFFLEDSLFSGAKFSDIFKGEDSFKFSLTVDRCVRLGSESSFNANQKDSKGKDRYYQVNIRPIEVDGQSGAMIVIKDNTKKVLNERTLHQAKLRAESSDLAKTQFLANISHEVRTPMNIIMGYASLIADSKLSQKDRDDFVDKILGSGHSLMSLLDKALQVSSGSTESISLNVQDFPLFPALKRMMRHYTSEKVEINLEYRLPLNQKIRTDKERLIQALGNLMDNAVKFTKEGSIELIVEELNGRVSFCVSDTGIGVSRDQWKRLFNPFTQADESFTRDFGGSGLGLAVVKHLGKTLGGGARVKESTPGLGSTFEFWLDSVLISASKREERPGRPMDSPQYPNLSHAKILLVEDVEENRFLIKHYLKEIKCRVDTACDGREALIKLQESEYDLILMDLQMPRLDGYGATEVIRRNDTKTPIIALTAHSLQKDIEKCKAVGFNGHLSKPVGQSQLLSKVNRTIGKTL